MTKKEQRQKKIEELNRQKQDLMRQIDSIVKVKEFVQFPVLTGRTVKNKKFGEGVIAESGGQYFTVSFSQGDKKYAFPDSFAKGFLEIDDEELVASCKKYGELLIAEESLKGHIKKINEEISSISA